MDSAFALASDSDSAIISHQHTPRTGNTIISANLERLPVTKLRVSLLSGGASLRRSGQSSQHVRALAESDEPLPPILVQRASMSVIDGAHRLLAAKMRGWQDIDARLIDGDEASCFVIAVRANVTHGLPLSLADRKAAALEIMCFYPQWSDRMIASVSGLAAKTVARLRGRPTEDNHQLDGRIGRDGRMRPVNIAERRKAAADMIAEQPDASLREIALQAGISPETVREVRLRLRADQEESASPQHQPGSGARQGTRELPLHTPGVAHIPVSVLQALRKDPALRSSEYGRLLLRMLAALEVLKTHTDQIADAVPAHNVGRVAEASRACARAWENFAQSTQRRHEAR